MVTALDFFRRSVEFAEKHRAAASVVSGVRSVAPQKLQVDPVAAT